MIFGKKSIQDILNNKKSQTRRLVKEGEIGPGDFGNSVMILKNNIYPGRIKWQVGKSYAVCPGRGKKGLLYCPKCYSISAYSKEVWCAIKKNHKEEIKMKPLRVVIKSIRKEMLLDISEVDAKKEGYSHSREFISAFANINLKELKKLGLKVLSKEEALESGCDPLRAAHAPIFDFEKCNPFVWRIEFEVMK